MDTAELDMESAELLPDRQALGCWKWSPCGHEYYSYTSWCWHPTQATSCWGWGR